MGNLRQKLGGGWIWVAAAGWLLACAPAWASAAAPLSSGGGCGSGTAQFSVVTDSAVLGGAPKADESRIVVYQAGQSVFSTPQIFRVGLDGAWSGALRDYSWQLFTVSPGVHHVCVEWESPEKKLSAETATAVVQAQAGETSYLELSIAGNSGDVTTFYLFGVDPGEGNAVAGSLPHAVALAEKQPPHLLR